MINEAIILLGGMGTRLLPYTKTVSKEMLPIYDVPMVFLLVKEAYLAKIKRIIFVVNEHNINLIKSFFSKDDYLNNFLKDKPDKLKLLDEVNEIINNMEFVYVLQDLKGTYGALYSAKDKITGDNFIVMYGDDYIDNEISVTKQLITEFNKTGKMQVATKKFNKDELPKVGVVKLKDNYIIDLVKKDEENSSLVIHGRMLLNKKIFDVKNSLHLHDNNEYYLPYALLKFKGEIMSYEYKGKYFNLGEKDGYIKASINYAIKKDKSLLQYIKSL